MKVLQHSSLGDQVSKKISAWILILVASIIAALFSVSFFLSHQMFNKQVNIWRAAVPQYAITNLIDSDHFSIAREIEFLKSTGLFSTFVITDNQKRVISQFGKDHFSNSNLIPIQDEAKVVWGYYYFKPDFYHFFSSFFVFSALLLVLILIAFLTIRWRIRFNLEFEFSRFNNFLNEIEIVTEKLHEFYNPETDFSLDSKKSYSAEQVIINRAISRLLNEIKKANKSLREAILSAEQRRFREELTRTALQVAHDIGSPLALLETIVQSTSLNLPEDSRVSIRNAAGRIRDISNSFLKKAKPDLINHADGPLSQKLLNYLIHQVVSEKRMQFDSKVDIQFNESSYMFFALIRSADFCRVLSNLINNAVEAIGAEGKVIISLLDFNNEIVINIQDNGKGIREEILGKLGELGNTHGKPQGLGMGLYHAITTIKEWNGKLDIQSKEGQGTTVQIHLPKTQPPSWFVPEIKIVEGQTIVIIDDDESIHAVWKERFMKYQHQIKLLHFFSPESLVEWKDQNRADLNILYLCDYEFIGSKMNGIDLITALKINYLSILVTSLITHGVTASCELHGIKLLPKDISKIVPLAVTETH